MRYHTALGLCFVALCGCDSTGSDRGALTLDVSAASFVAGAEVSAVVQNGTEAPLYLYQCGGRVVLEIQKRDMSEWEVVAFANNPCTGNLDQSPFQFGAGAEQGVSFLLRSPGEYRLRATYGLAADFDTYTEVVTSDAFEVRAP